jgi:ferric-dicitrate binding protein FerR (iron transport regulator)
MQELFKKYLENKCSPDEVKLLLKEFDTEKNKELLKSLIIQQLETEQGVSPFNEQDLENIVADTLISIKAKINFEKKTETLVVPLAKRKWFRLAAAAVFVIAVSGTYILLNRSPEKTPAASNEPITNDIPPGGNKASLVLANGSIIILESASNGTIAQEGNTKILKTGEGQLVYNLLNEKPAQVLYNTVTTPRGGQYQLLLADGSKVWLNAASSIRFPISFNANERIVDITGEAYFEVAKNASMPFKVVVGGKGEVEVLGTHFNISAYADESNMNTTLLEGSVKVTGLTTHDSRLISPGQQAQLNTNGQIVIIKKPDLDKVIAWKNGFFNFDGADTKTVMRFLGRWYDVDVVYEGAIPQREFAGEIEKKLNLSQVLKILEKNNLHFKLEGRKLVVTPQ